MKINLVVDSPSLVNAENKSVFQCSQGFLLTINHEVFDYTYPTSKKKKLYNYKNRIIYFEPDAHKCIRMSDFEGKEVIDWITKEKLDLQDEVKLAIAKSDGAVKKNGSILFYERDYGEEKESVYIFVDLMADLVRVKPKRHQLDTSLSEGFFFYDFRKKECCYFDAVFSELIWKKSIQYDGDYKPLTQRAFNVAEFGDLIFLPIYTGNEECKSFISLINSKDGSECDRIGCDEIIYAVRSCSNGLLVLTENKLIKYPFSDEGIVDKPEVLFVAENPVMQRGRVDPYRNFFYSSEDIVIACLPIYQCILVISNKGGRIINSMKSPEGWFPRSISKDKSEIYQGVIINMARIGGPQFHRYGVVKSTIEDLKTKQTFDVEPEPTFEAELDGGGNGDSSSLKISLSVKTFDNAIRFGEMKSQDLAYEYGHVVPYRTEANPGFNGEVHMVIRSSTEVGERLQPYLEIMEKRFARWAEYEGVRSGDGSQKLCSLRVTFEADA